MSVAWLRLLPFCLAQLMRDSTRGIRVRSSTTSSGRTMARWTWPSGTSTSATSGGWCGSTLGLSGGRASRTRTRAGRAASPRRTCEATSRRCVLVASAATANQAALRLRSLCRCLVCGAVALAGAEWPSLRCAGCGGLQRHCGLPDLHGPALPPPLLAPRLLHGHRILPPSVPTHCQQASSLGPLRG